MTRVSLANLFDRATLGQSNGSFITHKRMHKHKLQGEDARPHTHTMLTASSSAAW